MEEPSDGVFGNLPASRPGARSPRRDAEEKAERKPAAKRAAAKPPPPPPPESTPAQEPERAPDVDPPDEPAKQENGGGVEDLAWAGVTVAAKAATAGVKLMSRALESARKQVERPPKP